MEFFKKIFDGMTSLSQKLPSIELQSIFIIALIAIAGIGIIIGLTYLGSKASKMKNACSKIIKYLANVNAVNEDNAEEFTTTCFGKKVPVALSDTWVEYLGVRYGFPSEVISEPVVFDREVKRVSYARANIFIAISLLVTALLAFWGLGSIAAVEMGVLLCCGLFLSGVVYLILIVVAHVEFAKARELFYEMQDDLDAKVDFEVGKSYASDTSPLLEMAAVIDEIVARNTEKEVEMPEDEVTEDEIVEEPAEEYIEEEVIEDEVVEEPIEEPVDEVAEEIVEEDATADVEEEIIEDEAVEENVEEGDEEDMFGRRKREREAAAQIPQEEMTFLESEVVEEDRDYLESEVVENEVPENQEIVEEEEDLDEGDADVKAPKLSKLPSLMDFIMSKNLSSNAKMTVATAMVGVCAKFKKDPDNFKLAKKATAKVLTGIVKDKLAERQAN